jgi:hypothetical protein
VRLELREVAVLKPRAPWQGCCLPLVHAHKPLRQQAESRWYESWLAAAALAMEPMYQLLGYHKGPYGMLPLVMVQFPLLRSRLLRPDAARSALLQLPLRGVLNGLHNHLTSSLPVTGLPALLQLTGCVGTFSNSTTLPPLSPVAR